MIKGFLPILYTSAGVTAAGVTGYVVLEPQFATQPEKEIVLQSEPDSGETAVAALTTDTQPVIKEEAEAEVPEVVDPKPVIPVFSLLRVEKDGSVVVAGNGPGESEISLWDGTSELAKTKSGGEGDFVFVLDKPLAPGVHELTLRAQPVDGEPVFSTEAGLINIPEPETPEEVTVLVSEAGEATRVLQKPEPEVEVAALAPEVAPEPEPEPVVEQPEEVVEQEPEQPEEPVEPEEVAKIEEPEVEPEVLAEPEPVKPVLLEAADIENNKVFIAGTAEPGTNVNIYLDSKLFGTTAVGNNGAFLYEGIHAIDAGRYDIRADMIKRSSGEVLARAEVTLVHEPEPEVQVAAVEPEVATGAVIEEEPATEPEETAVEPEAQEPEEVAEPEAEPQPVEVAAVEPVTKELRTGTAVIIRRGDNLWRVARRNYGQGIRYTTIFEANREQIRDPDLIYPGQVFKVPQVEGVTEVSTDG